MNRIVFKGSFSSSDEFNNYFPILNIQGKFLETAMFGCLKESSTAG